MLNQNGDGSSNSLKDQKRCFACHANSKTSHCVEMDPEEDRWYDYESPPCGSGYNHGFSDYSVPDTPRAVAYVASLWGGSIGGIVVGVLVIILVSMPLCCGVLKH